MIRTVESFIGYFEGIRRRTLKYLQAIPEDSGNWAPKAGEFTYIDLIHHLAAAEAMFIGVAVNGEWRYAKPPEPARASLEAALVHLTENHAQAINQLRGLADAELDQPRPTLEGPPVKAWRLLMAMVEHETHHRSQVAVHLSLMGVEPPQIYGLGVEDVIARITG
jgi:uncharacterized damage-inducible protein DinB